MMDPRQLFLLKLNNVDVGEETRNSCTLFHPMRNSRLNDFKSTLKQRSFHVAFCLSVGFFFFELVRISINIALPFITEPFSSTFPNSTDQQHFDCKIWQKFLILVAYYVACVVSTPLSVYLNKRKSPKFFLMFTSATTSLLCILLPTVSQWSFYYVAGVQFMFGTMRIFTLPAFIKILGNWIPISTRGKAYTMIVIAFSAAHIIGSSIVSCVSSSFRSIGGWAIAYYCIGLQVFKKKQHSTLYSILQFAFSFFFKAIFGFTWMAFLVMTVTSNPEKCQTIQRKEKLVLLKTLETEQKVWQAIQRNDEQVLICWKTTFLSPLGLISFLKSVAILCAIRCYEIYSPVVNFHLRQCISVDFMIGIMDSVPMLFHLIGFFTLTVLSAKLNRTTTEQQACRDLDFFSFVGSLSIAVSVALLPLLPCDQLLLWYFMSISFGLFLGSCISQGNFKIFFFHINVPEIQAQLFYELSLAECGTVIWLLACSFAQSFASHTVSQAVAVCTPIFMVIFSALINLIWKSKNGYAIL
ncbi:putative transporter -like protein [Trichinella murrelli]|uniref:Putative transporter-like protein n=1 Tax=Trichinella murrelli TaxID=144512 RepID=A0A0V0TAT8_9BILA|nr:putative transporter -like protein [Trichinella murrelli]